DREREGGEPGRVREVEAEAGCGKPTGEPGLVEPTRLDVDGRGMATEVAGEEPAQRGAPDDEPVAVLVVAEPRRAGQLLRTEHGRSAPALLGGSIEDG